MKIMAKSKRISLGEFERTSADYDIFARMLDDYNRGLDLPWHPLLFDMPDAYPLQYDYDDLFIDVTKKVNQKTSKQKNLRILLNGARPRCIGTLGLKLIPGRPRRVCVSLAIQKRWRKKGFAAEAIELLCRELRDYCGASIVCAGVSPGNKASLQLFRSLGFKDLGILKRKKSTWAVIGDVYMEKNCQNAKRGNA